MNNSSLKFFLYARKSTDVEDKQVLSIEAQLTELRAFAKQNDLEIVEELVEKQSAKIPGRPIFNEMVEKIENGEASGIIAWHPDRLARNSVDGGKIIYLLDCGRLTSLKFPQFWFEPTPQGKFMLNIAFGQSKYYVDSLAENTKRGLRQKVRRGEFPSLAPMGYRNDPRSKIIVIDKKRGSIIRQAFELYAQGNSRLEDISIFLAQQGIVSRFGKRLHKDRITYFLSNPFYIGLFRYGGEIHEGKHEPLVSKKMFDRVQEVLKKRGKPKASVKTPKAFTGLIRCGHCGMMVTAEVQKGHTYYRCTRKSKAGRCVEPYVREESLNNQLSSLLQTFSLRKDWANTLRHMMEEEEKSGAQSSTAFVQETQKNIYNINAKLQRLLDGYLDQDIDREIYRERKSSLLSDKKSLEEQVTSLEQKRTAWLEPMRIWVAEAENLSYVAGESNLFEKKVAAEKVFGSNLRLTARKVVYQNPEKGVIKTENAWAALAAANQNVGKMPISQVCVSLYNSARTFFMKNS